MPKSDSWPGGVSKEPVSGVNSTGSCDSMVSINSDFSDDSLEHLSAEEKACLMFLEETIESLDVEDDSGLSNDEPDYPYRLAGKVAHNPSAYYNKPKVHDVPNKVIARDHRPSAKYLVPTPLLVATGNTKLDSRPSELSPKEKPVVLMDGTRSASGLPQTPMAALKRAEFPQAGTAKQSTGQLIEAADLPPSFIPEPPVRSHASTSSLNSLDAKKQQKVYSEKLQSWIPPPSDFMDETDKGILRYSAMPQTAVEPPPEWTPELPNPGGSAKLAEVIKPNNIDSALSRKSMSKNDIENLRQKALLKKTPLTPIMILQQSGADKPRTPSPSSEHVPSFPKEYKDPKTPPPVAPKHKLPSNIILKSHKEPGNSHSLLSPSTSLDQQKIRTEALKKLGLLKTDDVDSGPSVSPINSPTYKSKDSSSVSPQNPSVYSTSPTLESSPKQSRFTGFPVSVDTQLPMDTKPRDVAGRESFLRPRPYEIKSSSLGRSGVGLSSIVVEPQTSRTNFDTTNVELSPGQLQKSRARPLSVESAKDLSFGHSNGNLNKSFHSYSGSTTHTGGEAQRLPRSNGISVVITPNGKNGENRREALRKLGLLKDGSGY